MFRKKEKGIFVMESIIALLLFGIIILTLAYSQGVMFTRSEDVKNKLIAVEMADNLVGQIALDKVNIGNYSSGSGIHYSNWLNELSGRLPGVNEKQPVIEVSGASNNRNVKVTLYWKKSGTNNYSEYTTNTTLY